MSHLVGDEHNKKGLLPLAFLLLGFASPRSRYSLKVYLQGRYIPVIAVAPCYGRHASL